MSCDASARSCAFVTYAGLHSSAALQDDESRPRLACIDGCIALAARRDDECISRPRLAASGRIDGVAAACLHPSAARHDARRLRMAVAVAGLEALHVSSWRRIDLRLSAAVSYEWKALPGRRCIDLRLHQACRQAALLLFASWSNVPKPRIGRTSSPRRPPRRLISHASGSRC